MSQLPPQTYPHPTAPPYTPPLALTIVISALFGPFGAIPASQGARAAQAAGQPQTRYWVAFGVSWAASVVLLVIASVVIPLLFFAAALAGADRAEVGPAEPVEAPAIEDAPAPLPPPAAEPVEPVEPAPGADVPAAGCFELAEGIDPAYLTDSTETINVRVRDDTTRDDVAGAVFAIRSLDGPFAATGTTDFDGVCSIPVPETGEYELTVDLDSVPAGLTVGPDFNPYVTTVESGTPRTIAVRLLDADAPTEEEAAAVALEGASSQFLDLYEDQEARDAAAPEGEYVTADECGLLPTSAANRATGLDLVLGNSSVGAGAGGLYASCGWTPSGVTWPETGDPDYATPPGVTLVGANLLPDPSECGDELSDSFEEVGPGAVRVDPALDSLWFDPYGILQGCAGPLLVTVQVQGATEAGDLTDLFETTFESAVELYEAGPR